jgi:hypothetical protein
MIAGISQKLDMAMLAAIVTLVDSRFSMTSTARRIDIKRCAMACMEDHAGLGKVGLAMAPVEQWNADSVFDYLDLTAGCALRQVELLGGSRETQ